MNEHIKSLFKQAGGSIEIDSEGNLFTYTDNFDPEVFASLIARDCITLCETLGAVFDCHYGADAISRKYTS
jgi:hypothetical protein